MGLAAEDLGDATDAGCNKRYAGRSSLKRDIGKRLVPRGHDDDPGKPECRPSRHGAEKADLADGRQGLRQRFEMRAVRPFADNDQMRRPAQQSHGLDEGRHALKHAQFADEQEIRGTIGMTDRQELIPGQTIVNNGSRRTRLPDLGDERRPAELGFENETVCPTAHQPLCSQKRKSVRRQTAVMKRAAMRRVDPNGILAGRDQPGQQAALRAVAVNDIRLQACDQRADLAHVGEIAKTRQPAHRYDMQSKSTARFKRRNPCRRNAVVRWRGADDASCNACRLLPCNEVMNMTEKAAHRQPHHMQHPGRLDRSARYRHRHQKYRSLTRMVSPGMTSALLSTLISTMRSPRFRVIRIRFSLAR